jgi:undecaprenyl-diphosphatase
MSWFEPLRAWLKRIEISILLTLTLTLGSIWLFVLIADELVLDGPQRIDEQILLALREPDDSANPIGPKWVEETVRDFTAFGSTGIVLFIMAGVLGCFLLQRNFSLAWLLLLTIGGSLLLTYLLKAGFDRPRPELVPHIMFASTASFPSGHSSVAATTYLMLGTLIARMQDARRFKAYIMGFAVLLVFLVGFSRVYLGVHWPSDVLGGWILGAVWVLTVLQGARWWQRHRP